MLDMQHHSCSNLAHIHGYNSDNGSFRDCVVSHLIGIRTFRSPVFSLLGVKVPSGTFAPRNESSPELSLPGTNVPRSKCSPELSFLVISSLSDHSMGCLQYADMAILVKNHRIFPLSQCFCPPPRRRGSLRIGYRHWRSKMRMMGQSD